MKIWANYELRFAVDQAKGFFFDAPRVLSAMDKKTHDVLSMFGAYVRRTAKGYIRKARKPSKPGNPPHSHEGTLRNFLFFAWDPDRRSVVIGPAKTNQLYFEKNRKPVRGTVPEVLEYGGAITVLEVFRHGKWERADLRSRRRLAGLKLRYRTVHIKARPYMGPALAKELPKLPAMWAGSITKKIA